MKIGFIGMSHLGLCYLAASAEKKCKVIGYTKDVRVLKSLSKLEFNINEPRLEMIVNKNYKNIKFTDDINTLNKVDLIFISLDVKTSTNGTSNLSDLNEYLEIIYKNIKKNKILVLLSQVPPGFTDKIKWDRNKLYYQVETLVFGNAIERALKPERIIIGKNTKQIKINKHLINYYNLFTNKHIVMSYKSAELTKISINIFLASTLTATNTIAEICENISADWDDIIPALRSDKRIGKFAYLKPGLGIGGGNILRDIKSIKKISVNNLSDNSLMNAILFNSRRRQLWIAERINEILLKKKIKTISLLGLSYKSGTNSTLNSPSIFLIEYFRHITFYAYDPIVTKTKKYKNLILCENYYEAIKSSNIVIVATPHKDFLKINFNSFNNINFLFDPLGFIDSYVKKNKFKYFKLGN